MNYYFLLLILELIFGLIFIILIYKNRHKLMVKREDLVKKNSIVIQIARYIIIPIIIVSVILTLIVSIIDLVEYVIGLGYDCSSVFEAPDSEEQLPQEDTEEEIAPEAEDLSDANEVTGVMIPKEGQPTTEWKFYKNNEYQFEISYPGDWTLREYPWEYGQPAADPILAIKRVTLSGVDVEGSKLKKTHRIRDEDIDIVFNRASEYETETMEEFMKKQNASNPQLTTIQGLTDQGLEVYEGTTCGEGCYYTVFIKNDDYFYSIVFEAFLYKYKYEELDEIERQILSTFRIID